jgi:hypothetical protein
VRKTVAAALATLLAGSGTAATAAEGSRRGARTGEARPSRLALEPHVIGMITYDTGVNAGFHPDVPAGSPNLNRLVGNRFNSLLGGPLLFSNRVFSVTLFPAHSGPQSISIATGPNSMGTAMVVDYLNANLVANQFNQIPISPPAFVQGGEFLALFVGTFGGTNPGGLLGMSDMGTMGQGYHAIQGFYQGDMLATMLQAVPNRNAMIRARIDVFPVELMEFEVR